MQAATPMSDRVVTSATHTDIATSPHHTDTPSYHPARYGSNGAGRGAAALTGSSGHRQTNLYDKADFFFNIQIWPPPAHHHHITTLPPPRHTEQSPCKGMKRDAGGHTDE